MKLQDCFTQPMPMTGPCEVDIDKVCKVFGKTTFIVYNTNRRNVWRIVNVRAGIKCEISENDAREIIARLNLERNPSLIMRNAGTYAHPYLPSRKSNVNANIPSTEK